VVKQSNAERVLAVTLVAYVVCDILLTPAGGLETRDVAGVTVVGFATLALLFVGLALSILALVLLFRSPGRSPIVAIIAAVLYFPAPLVEQLGLFSRFQPPTAIARLELVQVVVAIIVIGVGLWVRRGGAAVTTSG
jgi:hypothetical protein